MKNSRIAHSKFLLAITAVASIGFGSQVFAQEAPAPAASVPSPGYADAMRMVHGAVAAADEMGVALGCAVVDIRGDLVNYVRMDGAGTLTLGIAIGKARGSAMLGQPSANLAQMADMLANINTTVPTGVVAIQGALPIVKDGMRVGAIGCSGASSQQDEDAARAGIEAVM